MTPAALAFGLCCDWTARPCHTFASVSAGPVGTDVHSPNGDKGLLTAAAFYVNVLKECPKKWQLVARTLAPLSCQ